MIKAEELRLGNLVYDTSGKVNTINLDAFKYLLSYGGTDICQVKPIPLTEEWLLKFGFKDESTSLTDIKFSYKDFVIYMDDNGFYCFDYKGKTVYITIDYVNQLQNLYFVLTGEELKIND